jgi:hypothetical protein
LQHKIQTCFRFLHEFNQLVAAGMHSMLEAVAYKKEVNALLPARLRRIDPPVIATF